MQAIATLRELPLLDVPRPAPVTRTETVALATAAAAGENAMHPDVYKAAILCWVGFLMVFWVTFWMSAEALFMVAIGTVYGIMAIGVPYMMSRVGPKRPAPTFGLREFTRRKFNTLYGPVEGFDALLQVIMVPLLLSIGGIAIGIAIHAARAAY
ncbi:MAG TPA: hypothetical protein VN718_05635 [Rhizomicrobium sp.]|nr:hypothetical protein [Rhizomicrobium sp.]